MKFETELHRAEGLGSAKSGVHHWIAQRITAIVLIPLGIWFLGAFIVLLMAPFEEAHRWLSSPWTVTFAVLFILIVFYHGYLGMQVIWEDYVSHELMKWVLLISTKFFSILMAIVAVVAILKVFLS